MTSFDGMNAVAHSLFDHVVLGTMDFGTAILELTEMKEKGFESFGLTEEQGKTLEALIETLSQGVQDISSDLETVFASIPNLAEKYSLMQKPVSQIPVAPGSIDLVNQLLDGIDLSDGSNPSS